MWLILHCSKSFESIDAWVVIVSMRAIPVLQLGLNLSSPACTMWTKVLEHLGFTPTWNEKKKGGLCGWSHFFFFFSHNRSNILAYIGMFANLIIFVWRVLKFLHIIQPCLLWSFALCTAWGSLSSNSKLGELSTQAYIYLNNICHASWSCYDIMIYNLKRNSALTCGISGVFWTIHEKQSQSTSWHDISQQCHHELCFHIKQCDSVKHSGCILL